ncbi:hypothetical protein KDX38_27900 [Pseudomonas sp. CDFA 602]|uniref:hypothetical protein n=1 Tax=Pseudomonas californiensis TaxID=2829823 RepID=UPI001E459DBC|nr:hypothetical protein [Pseudomonas californiensis]MCD5996798.1 hypothetical protein [Pseudomonas californiensis]MCD6002984.1 hypothetical protein [Pseudomonas californiensis]
MDELISQMYKGLSTNGPFVGGVFESPEDENEWYVPLLCQGERFIMIFGLISSDPVATHYTGIIRTDAGHNLSSHAYSLKYAAASVYFSKNRFAPLQVAGTTRNLLRQTVPELLVVAVQTFIGYRPTADEFYFIAGAEEDKRIDKLNLWYHRIGGSLASSIGFSPVHRSKGDWHGYRKTHD